MKHTQFYIVTHAQAALENMNAANRDNNDNPHANEGINHLRETIVAGKKNHAKLATRHAEEALSHMEALIYV